MQGKPAPAARTNKDRANPRHLLAAGQQPAAAGGELQAVEGAAQLHDRQGVAVDGVHAQVVPPGAQCVHLQRAAAGGWCLKDDILISKIVSRAKTI